MEDDLRDIYERLIFNTRKSERAQLIHKYTSFFSEKERVLVVGYHIHVYALPDYLHGLEQVGGGPISLYRNPVLNTNIFSLASWMCRATDNSPSLD